MSELTHTAIIYTCGCISESDVTIGYEPPHFCTECGAPSERYFSERDHPTLMKALSAYIHGDEMVGTDYDHREYLEYKREIMEMDEQSAAREAAKEAD